MMKRTTIWCYHIVPSLHVEYKKENVDFDYANMKHFMIVKLLVNQKILKK